MNRRDFLQTTAATMALLMGAEELRAADPPPAPAPSGPPVGCGVIGLGEQGRALAGILARLPAASTVALCDTYAPFIARGKEIAPKADTFDDYRKLLEASGIQAVLIATPSPNHKEIALAAIQAGKHVYCEAPLAITIDDSRAIAQAGLGSKATFQSGLQSRSNPQYLHALTFMRSGVLDTVAEGRAQWHKKESWRRAAPTPEREKAMNWRLSLATSAGLMGEIGIHQIDTLSWFLKQLPAAVSGFGGILKWQDGRDVADTVQCVFEYPAEVHAAYDATLVNSFDGHYELLLGSDSALLLRGLRAWMIKEADSPLWGWEVYAKKDKIGDDIGISLVADATKLLAQGKDPARDSVIDPTRDPLYVAIEDFVHCVQTGKKPNAGPLEGHQATAVAIHANDAVVKNGRVEIDKSTLELA